MIIYIKRLWVCRGKQCIKHIVCMLLLIYFLYLCNMISVSNKYLEDYTFIDLFAGLGGFRLALESWGAHCVYSNEWDKDAQKVYASNFGDTFL